MEKKLAGWIKVGASFTSNVAKEIKVLPFIGRIPTISYSNNITNITAEGSKY